jgi:hypothetical protein
MHLLKIFLLINPKGTYKDFVDWYKSLSETDKAIHRHNLEILKGHC